MSVDVSLRSEKRISVHQESKPQETRQQQTSPEKAFWNTRWPIHHIRQKQQNAVNNPNKDEGRANLNVLPNEILVEITSYMTFKEMYQFSTINTHMRDICRDPRFWNKINLPNATVPRHLIQKFIDSKTQYLGLPYCSIETGTMDILTDGKTSELLHIND